MKKIIIGVVVIAAVLIGYYAYKNIGTNELPENIATGNGRIEAVEINIATKTPGKIRDILVNEGDFVTSGQILAYMDTDQLVAQKREAEAALKQQQIAVDTAKLLIEQRNAERTAAESTVNQYEASYAGALKKLQRSEALAKTSNIPLEELDDQKAATLEAKAMVDTSKAKLVAAETGINSAKSQSIAAEYAVDVAKATIERLDADLNDSVLRAPRDGRVQYRVSEPGEVLNAGGNVLNMIDLSDVYMNFFLPTKEAGRLAIGDDVRITLDTSPDHVIPAKISFVSDVAQFTPKTVETKEEREKLMFRVKARISPELLKKYIRYVKTGLPGAAYVRLDKDAEWPENLNSTVE